MQFQVFFKALNTCNIAIVIMTLEISKAQLHANSFKATA